MSSHKVLLVGSNPARKSPDGSPFHPTTRSRTILEQWFDEFDADFAFINVSDEPTENNRPLRVPEIKENLPALQSCIEELRGYKIVALGRTAERALKMLEVEFFAMFHPSGCNRLLNDKELVKGKLQELKEFLSH